MNNCRTKQAKLHERRDAAAFRGVERPKNPFETSGRARRIAASREGREQRRDGTAAGAAPRPNGPAAPSPTRCRPGPPRRAPRLRRKQRSHYCLTTPGAAHRGSSPQGTVALRREESPASLSLSSAQRRCHRHQPFLSGEGRQSPKRSATRASGAAAAAGPSRAPPALTERRRCLSPSPTALPAAPAAQPPLPRAHPRLQTKRRENCARLPPPPLPPPHVTRSPYQQRLQALAPPVETSRSLRPSCRAGGGPGGPAGRGRQKRREVSPPFSGVRRGPP